MFPILGIIAAGVASALTAGETVGLGLTAIGLGAGIKGLIDQNEADEISAEALESYHAVYKRLCRKAESVKNRLERFMDMKRSVYQNEIKNAVEILSYYKAVNLSAYQETGIKSLHCIAQDINDLGCFADEPENAVSFFAKAALLAIPIAGFNLAAKGTEAKTRAELMAANTDIEIARMEKTMIALEAITARIKEGEYIIQELISRAAPVISALTAYRATGEKQPSVYIMKQVEAGVLLAKALKAVIEVDILTPHGHLNGNSGIVFSKVRREVINEV
ncbi:hypothetical protein TREPR_0886 [Treponema primitia ZAS-2]|uniref:Uncharacterized protein n=1 Tax=Treponema primitia (strain ATCC BAA-887 / DSM 12427 / ZAS-2) TaxID=545694 RepID=F5YIL1_TREPZ|nr:hypothetical protein [Treponema primitia]AEF85888.1 hypothetical protein TREPR_0886 [Treponema primitia ZAS-2]